MELVYKIELDSGGGDKRNFRDLDLFDTNNYLKTEEEEEPMMMPFLLMELPSELLLHVLTRLRLKYLMRLRCVSKFFHDLTNNPYFITSYCKSNPSNIDFNFMETSPPPSPSLNNLIPCKSSNQWPWRFHIFFKGSNFIYIQKRHELLIPFHCPTTKRLIGSANGLVCFGGTDSLEIYNIFAGTNYYLIPPIFPSTMPPLFIPPAPRYNPPNPIFVFGYDPISNDYKILCIEYEHYRRAVYSFGTNSWKSMPLDWNSSPIYRYNSEGEGRTVCINGVIYWPPGRHHYCYHDKIVLFDVHTEQFKLIQLPKKDLLLPTQYADIQLISFRGGLAFAFIKRRTSSSSSGSSSSSHGGTGGVVGGEIWVELFTLNDLNLSNSVYRRTGAAHGRVLKDIFVKCFISSESKHLWNKHSFVVPIPSPTKEEEEVEIVSCCDEIFLGWFESNQLRLYNLHTKCIFNLPLSPPSHYYPKASFMEKKKDNPTYVDNLSFDFSLI